MNERLKDLAEQAGYFIKFEMNEKGDTFLVHTKEPGTAGDLALFGKLIIKECTELFDPGEQSERGYRIGDRIYKHFGEK